MSDDSDDLRLLVEMAAAGQLSASETADVESLIADKPALRAQYERLRQPAPAPPAPASGRRQGNPQGSGCLLAIISAVVAGSLVIAGAVFVRGGDDAPQPVDPVDAILNDAGIEVLPLEGPADLTDLGRLALVYSPDDGDAVLIGDDIVSGGELVQVEGDQQNVLATFEAGDVSIVLPDIDTDASFTIRALP